MKKTHFVSLRLCKALLFLLLFYSQALLAQDPAAQQTSLTSSPAAASLGSYSGLHQVNYYTGMAITNIPLYTLKYEGVSLPISLMYNASGVKVNSIAGNIGTGWALNAGGVIIREVRGIPDDNYTYQEAEGYQYHNSYVATINPNNGEETVGSMLNHINANKYDGEPDIFNFSFGGRSGKFLIDVVDGVLKVRTIPLQDLKIEVEKTISGDPYHISGFVITDESGVQYIFRNVEVTHSTTVNQLGATNSTDYHSAWYLSKIISANKSEINFQYNAPLSQTIVYPVSQATNHCLNDACVYTDIDFTTRGAERLYFSTSTTTLQITTQLLSKIVTEAEEIVFTSVSNRTDITGGKSISEIAIYNKRFSTIPVLGKKYILEYQQYGVGTQRPYLSSLKEQITNGGTAAINTYKFSYENANLIPAPSSNAIDVWGYYNGQTSNQTRIPILFVYTNQAPHLNKFSVFFRSESNTVTLPGANRNPNETYAKYGTLSRVDYPDGGYTEYEYELHRVNTPNYGVVAGGGLRLKKATTYDGFNPEKKLSRRYEYLNGSITSGKIVSLPIFGYDIGDYGDDTKACDNYDYYKWRINRGSEPFNGSDIYNIGYTKVTEYVGDNGRSEFEYTMPGTEGQADEESGFAVTPGSNYGRHPDFVSDIFRISCGAPVLATSAYTYPFAPKSEFDWGRGLLVSQKNYAPGGTTPYYIKSNTYTLRSGTGDDAPVNMVALKYVKIKNYGDHALDGIGNPTYFYWYAYSKYYHATGYVKLLSSTVETFYDQKPGSNNTLISTTAYSYDNPGLIVPTSIKVTNSDGIEYRKRIIYNSEYANLSLVTTSNNMAAQALKEMQAPASGSVSARHILNLPVETISYLKKPGQSEVVVEATLTTYKILALPGSPIVPDKYFKLDVLSPSSSFVVSRIQPSGTSTPGEFIFSNAYRQVQSFDQYDSRSNLIQMSVPNGAATTTKYLGDISVATFTNSKQNECSYLGFERGTINAAISAADEKDDFWSFYNTIGIEPTDAHSGKNSLKLYAGGSFTSRTITISTPGKYVLSCWVKPQSGYGTNQGALKIGTTSKNFSNTNGVWTYVEVIADISTSQLCQIINSSTAHYVLIDDIQFKPYSSNSSYSTFDPAYGLVTSKTDNNQLTSYSEYDSFGRLLKTLDNDRQLRTYMAYYQKSTSSSTDRSYTKTYMAVASGVAHTSELVVKNSTNIRYSVSYLDGLGRAVQTAQVAASPLGNDIVIPYDYDHLGRQTKNYLSFASSDGLQGVFRADALTPNTGQQSMFYRKAQRIPRAINPWYENRFENNNLNRLVERAAPGFEWRMQNGHTELHYYRTNTCLDDILYWKRNAISGVWEATQLYDEGTLYVTELRDQNFHWIITFKDKMGREICKYTQKRTSETDANAYQTKAPSFSYSYYTVTYNLYDDLGQLYAVIDPEGMQKLADQKAFSLSTSFINKWVTTFEYDIKGRVTAKNKGKENEELFVYDKLDRSVLNRTNTLSSGKWNYAKFDEQGRAIVSGIYDGGSATQGTLQTIADNSATVLFENRSNVSFSALQGYTNNAFPVLATADYANILSVSYYDDYDFDYNGTADVTNTATRTLPDRGRLMGGKQRSLKSDGTVNANWIQSENYYDDLGRIIKTRKDNHANIGGSDMVESLYDFNNKLSRTYRTCVKTRGSSSTTNIAEEYYYDNMLRLTKTYHTINSGPRVLVSKLNYNELGQTYEKNLHSTNDGASYLQSVDYSYDAQGHLTHINRLDLGSDLVPKSFNLYAHSLGTAVKANIGIYNFNPSVILGSALPGMMTKTATQVSDVLKVELYKQGGPVNLATPDYLFTAMSDKLITDLGTAHGGLANFEMAITSTMPCGITSYSNDQPTVGGLYQDLPAIQIFQKTFIDKLKNQFGGITNYTRTQIRQKAYAAYQDVYMSFQLQYNVATSDSYFLPNENQSLTQCGQTILSSNFISAFIIHIGNVLPQAAPEDEISWEDVSNGLVSAVDGYSDNFCNITIDPYAYALPNPAIINIAAIEQIAHETAKGFTRQMEGEGFTESDFELFNLSGQNQSEAETDPEYAEKPYATMFTYENKDEIRARLTDLHSGGAASEEEFTNAIRTSLITKMGSYTPSSPLIGGQQIFNDDENDLWGLELKYGAVLSRVSARPQYNGNIAQAFWKLKGDKEISAYDYSYDALDRMTKASFYQYTDDSKQTVKKLDYYSVPEMTYDNNGNILTVKRNGNTSEDPVNNPAWGLQDNLVYKYDGNKLLSVNDLAEIANQQANIENLITDDGSEVPGTYACTNWALPATNGSLSRISVNGNYRLQLTANTLSDNPVMIHSLNTATNGEVYHCKMNIDLGTAQSVKVQIKDPSSAAIVDETIIQSGSYTFVFGVDQNYTNFNIELSASGIIGGGTQRKFSIDDFQLNKVLHLGTVQYGYNDNDVEMNGTEVLTATHEYKYNANGSMISDRNKGIKMIMYNTLNLPAEIRFYNGNKLEMEYATDGTKLSQVLSIYNGLTNTYATTTNLYSNGFVYENANTANPVLSYFSYDEGRVVKNASAFEYEYTIKDQAGSARITFKSVSGVAGIVQKASFYPFGMKIIDADISQVLLGIENPNGFNSQEWVAKDVLDMYDYGWRMYDPTLGRWNCPDPEDQYFSTYVYCGNNPVTHIDPDGRSVSFYPNLPAYYQTQQQNFGPRMDLANYNMQMSGAYGPVPESTRWKLDYDKQIVAQNRREYRNLYESKASGDSDKDGSGWGDRIRRNPLGQAMVSSVPVFGAMINFTNSLQTGNRSAAIGHLAMGVVELGGIASLSGSSVSGNYVYRGLTGANAESIAMGNGMFPKAVDGTWTLDQHLIRGSSPKSFLNDPWISTTRDFNIARSFSGGNGLVRIDLSKIPENSMQMGWSTLPRSSPAYHYSIWQQEVSIHGHIPQNAIQVIDWQNFLSKNAR